MALPLAVQLYSLREFSAKDFPGILKRVADIGYKLVEPAGLYNIRPSEFRAVLADLGLGMTSSHTPWARMGSVGEAMDIAAAMGLDRIVCGYGPNEFADLDAIKRTADEVNFMQEKCAKNGFTLFQHNHAFEFERIDGELKYGIFAKLCPNVKFQIDAFWSTNLGTEDPVEMLKTFADRTVSLHLKDGLLKQEAADYTVKNGTLDRKIELRALGSGEMDIPALIKAIPPTVDAIVVELDYCNIDMWDAIAQSYAYMTKNGFAVGNK